MKKWRVIAQPIVTAVARTVEAESPEAAIEIVEQRIDWCDLFRRLGQRSMIVSTDFADDFDCFIVDPVGEDGEPDTENAVWFKADGVTRFKPTGQSNKFVLWHTHEIARERNILPQNVYEGEQ